MGSAKQDDFVDVKVLSVKYQGITVFRRGQEFVINIFLKCEKCGEKSEGVFFQDIGKSLESKLKFEHPDESELEFKPPDSRVCQSCKTKFYTKLPEKEVSWWWGKADKYIESCFYEEMKKRIRKKSSISKELHIHEERIRLQDNREKKSFDCLVKYSKKNEFSFQAFLDSLPVREREHLKNVLERRKTRDEKYLEIFCKKKKRNYSNKPLAA